MVPRRPIESAALETPASFGSLYPVPPEFTALLRHNGHREVGRPQLQFRLKTGVPPGKPEGPNRSLSARHLGTAGCGQVLFTAVRLPILPSDFGIAVEGYRWRHLPRI